MRRVYRSIEQAREAFDKYAAVEPKLTLLWCLCRGAAPPARDNEQVNDVFDVDPFEADAVGSDTPDDGWCAEQFFFDNVKSRLMFLVGAYRRHGPAELQTTDAYDALYALLIDWALERRCPCCAQPDNNDWKPSSDGSSTHG